MSTSRRGVGDGPPDLWTADIRIHRGRLAVPEARRPGTDVRRTVQE
ncbi:hypothetical protein [Actinotalea solisilvae]|nr:hypothetical protein [Actinotalea solisilvae]